MLRLLVIGVVILISGCSQAASSTARVVRSVRPAPSFERSSHRGGGPRGSAQTLIAEGRATAARVYLEGLVRHREFGGAVLLALRGHVVLSAGYGWADLARRVRNSPRTRFRIGSLTKQFTAMAVLELQDAGRLSIADRVCGFISGCPAAWGQITLQELLTHTSGIPDYTTLPSYGRFSRHMLTPTELVALVRARPLLFAPGSRWSYSNTGYVLLGMVVERVTGQSYAGFLETHVLAPLGLRGTAYDVNQPPLRAHATGYSAWGIPAPYVDMSVPYAAGALESTTVDLYRWDSAVLSGRPALVRPPVLREMFTPWVLVDRSAPKSGAYGYGWFIDNRGQEYDHDGEINGFVSYNAVFPRARAEVIVLSNLESSDVRSIAEHLARLIGLHAA